MRTEAATSIKLRWLYLGGIPYIVKNDYSWSGDRSLALATGVMKSGHPENLFGWSDGTTPQKLCWR